MNKIMEQRVNDLWSQYSPHNWNKPEVFFDTLTLSELTIYMVGVSTKSGDSKLAVGSAVALETFPVERAVYELLERTALLESPEVNSQTNLENQIWQFSKSNGIAAHPTKESAQDSAFFELLERDSLLRSWFGSTTPILSEWPLPEVLHKASDYRFKIYEFPNLMGGNHFVFGVFGFPLKKGPLCYGFAAGKIPSATIDKAINECFQRLAFLWEEEPSEFISFSPTPDFHSEYYLHPKSSERIERWLNGEHSIYGNRIVSTEEIKIQYTDITPDHLKDRLYVIRAKCEKMLPLTFGYYRPKTISESFPEDLLIHPVA